MRRLPSLLFLATAMLIAAGCSDKVASTTLGGPAVVGTGSSVTEKRVLNPYTSVKITGAIVADVQLNDKSGVVVEAQPNIIPLVVTRVDGDQLIVEMSQNTSTTEPIKVHISTVSLQALDISGASTVKAGTFSNKSFTLTADGASKADLNGILGAAQLSASGASQITVVGSADSLKITADGASKVTTTDASVTTIAVECSAASTVRLGQADELNLKASGASTIHYTGTPKITNSISSEASTIGSG
jgi:hypothetical protein